MIRVLFLVFLFFTFAATAQNDSQPPKVKSVGITGGLSLSSNVYSNGGVGLERQSPFSYAITGSPTLRIKKITLPFTFTYSDQKFSYSHPFHRIGVSPTYKWAKLHLGYRSINYSSLTLGSRQFLGGGFELSPGKFYVSALYGRLDNLLAKRDELVYGARPVETYKRFIYGAKIGFGRKSGFDLIALKVKDDIASANPEQGDNTLLLPQDNIVLGANVRATLFKNFTLKLETAGSLHTNDARETIEIDSSEIGDILQKVNKLIKTNVSTRWGFAGKLDMKLNLKTFKLGFTYKRVEPNFKTLGVYYMLADYENYTANFSTRLFNKQLRLKLKGGFQRNNLSLERKATNLRKIGSVQINYANTKGFMVGINYNNIQTDQKAGYIEVEDSLRLAVSNSAAIFNTGYSWGKEKIKHSVNLNLGVTSFKDINEAYFVPIGDSKNNSINLNYQLSHRPSNTSYSIGTNYYTLESLGQESTGLGMNVGVGRKFFDKKLSVRLNTSVNKRKVNGVDDGYHLRLRNRITYKISKSQRLGFYFSWSKRPAISVRPLNETRANLSYSINF